MNKSAISFAAAFSAVALSFVALILVVGALATPVAAIESATPSNHRISSVVKTTNAGELVLVQTVEIDAPVEKVWAAYTTTEGWKSWVAPHAEFDLRLGGVIRTNYRPDGSIDAPDANTLRVVNYVPLRLLTLQADVSKNWPEIMQAQADHMFNVIVFERIDAGATRIHSYGTGYRDTPEFHQMMKFFISGNEATYEKLLAYVERGETAF